MAVLTVAAAPLTVTADNKTITDDDNLPVFTSTISGFRNGESNTVTSGPSYTVNPVYSKEHPGIYIITPFGLKLKYQNNYSIIYQSGNLYANDDDAKNVVPKLDCIQALTNDPSGFPFVANFSYNNPNSTVLYIPPGNNNMLSSTGHYSGQLPSIFQPGTGKFKIYFDGTKLTWTLITYNNNHGTSLASVASSTSSKCSSGTGTTQSPVQSTMSTETMEEPVIEPTIDPAIEPAADLYPNPSKGMVTIFIKNGTLKNNSIQITDAYGKTYQSIGKLLSDHSLQVDLSGKASGVYFVKVMVDGKWKVFRVVKM